jgi:hypothetical protein
MLMVALYPVLYWKPRGSDGPMTDIERRTDMDQASRAMRYALYDPAWIVDNT